jgi:hypothetical protein
MTTTRCRSAATLLSITLAIACPANAAAVSLTAAVWEYRDPITGAIGAHRLLREAGFRVIKLDTSRSPQDTQADVILLG